MVSYNVAKFGSHKHCSTEDVMALVCHVISEDHIYHPVKFYVHRHCYNADIKV